MTWYNENDPFAAEWLRALIAQDHVAPGRVDERNIANIKAVDVPLGQAHFFAGIGGWSYALRLAGWPDARAVWTGSCPCQPFSQAGARRGNADERHLWPVWRELIRECSPSIVFGEQVASVDGRVWLSDVRSDLEAMGYAVGAADMCAAGVGAPHIRQRLYWMAHNDKSRRGELGQTRIHAHGQPGDDAARRRSDDRAGYTDGERTGRDSGTSAREESGGRLRPLGNSFDASGADGRVGYTDSTRLEGRPCVAGDDGEERASVERTSGAVFWSQCDWLQCSDGKSRPVEPGSFPMAHGVPARVGRLRGYGNAIVPQVAATFIRAAIGALK